MIERALLNTDGGSRGNPGPSGIGFTLSSDSETGSATICQGGAYIGQATNNQAEYHALLWGLQNAVALGVGRLDIEADSQLLVRQIEGAYRVKNEGIKPLYAQACQLLDQFTEYTIKHVYRENNSQADALANEAMDKREAVGDFRVQFSPRELWTF